MEMLIDSVDSKAVAPCVCVCVQREKIDQWIVAYYSHVTYIDVSIFILKLLGWEY